MRQEHFRCWDCPFDCPGVFGSVEEFQDHIRGNHPHTFSPKELNNLENLSSRVDLHKAQGKCPMCLEFEIKSDRQYNSHVGAHLEQLALFVLPQSGEMHVEPEEEEDDNGQLLTEDSSVSDAGSQTHILPGQEDANEWRYFATDEPKAESRPVTVREQAADSTVDETSEGAGVQLPEMQGRWQCRCCGREDFDSQVHLEAHVQDHEQGILRRQPYSKSYVVRDDQTTRVSTVSTGKKNFRSLFDAGRGKMRQDD